MVAVGVKPKADAQPPKNSGTTEDRATSQTKAPLPEPSTPLLLDFFPLEGPTETMMAPFFRALKEGRWTTTRCPTDGILHWPPRWVCPECHRDELEWVDLPRGGTVYAFSAVLVGAPLGMEADVPFVVGLVDLDGVPLRLFGRIEGKTWDRFAIGDRVQVEIFDRPDGRVFYRFRSAD
ncbi:MAG: Zn-ribbon domain-containing OB-fold protein [Thermoplasmata archaeon]